MKFDFNKTEYEYLLENCLFTEDEEAVFRYKIKGKSEIQISMEMNISTRTVQRLSQKVRNKIKKCL